MRWVLGSAMTTCLIGVWIWLGYDAQFGSGVVLGSIYGASIACNTVTRHDKGEL